MGEVRLYPEIGGKTANLGSLDEIIEICKKYNWDDVVAQTIDLYK